MRLEVRFIRNPLLFSKRASKKAMARREVQQVRAKSIARSPKAWGRATAVIRAISISSMMVKRWRDVEASRMLDCTVTRTHCQ